MIRDLRWLCAKACHWATAFACRIPRTGSWWRPRAGPDDSRGPARPWAAPTSPAAAPAARPHERRGPVAAGGPGLPSSAGRSAGPVATPRSAPPECSHITPSAGAPQSATRGGGSGHFRNKPVVQPGRRNVIAVLTGSGLRQIGRVVAIRGAPTRQGCELGSSGRPSTASTRLLGCPRFLWDGNRTLAQRHAWLGGAAGDELLHRTGAVLRQAQPDHAIVLSGRPLPRSQPPATAGGRGGLRACEAEPSPRPRCDPRCSPRRAAFGLRQVSPGGGPTRRAGSSLAGSVRDRLTGADPQRRSFRASRPPT